MFPDPLSNLVPTVSHLLCVFRSAFLQVSRGRLGRPCNFTGNPLENMGYEPSAQEKALPEMSHKGFLRFSTMKAPRQPLPPSNPMLPIPELLDKPQDEGNRNAPDMVFRVRC